jgi:lycopene cyclase domain-containing protein
MLLFTVMGSFWLEIALKVNVLRRFKRASLSIAPVAIMFIAWDEYAIKAKHWHFDRNQILGVIFPVGLPLEEILFFLVIPIAAIMTIEAVRAVKKDWKVGDER